MFHKLSAVYLSAMLLGLIPAATPYPQTAISETASAGSVSDISFFRSGRTLKDACISAAAAGRSLSITIEWPSVSSVQCAAPIVRSGKGKVVPGRGQIVTLIIADGGPLTTLCD